VSVDPACSRDALLNAIKMTLRTCFFSGQDVRLWWFVLFSLLKQSRAVLPNESLVCDAILAHLLAGASKHAFVQQRRSH
jgi:hypothetical protein